MESACISHLPSEFHRPSCDPIVHSIREASAQFFCRPEQQPLNSGWSHCPLAPSWLGLPRSLKSLRTPGPLAQGTLSASWPAYSFLGLSGSATAVDDSLNNLPLLGDDAFISRPQKILDLTLQRNKGQQAKAAGVHITLSSALHFSQAGTVLPWSQDSHFFTC